MGTQEPPARRAARLLAVAAQRAGPSCALPGQTAPLEPWGSIWKAVTPLTSKAPYKPAPAKAGGKKDRYVILSPNLLELLRDWWRVARKKGWMAPGQPWLFPGYGSTSVCASFIGSFAWQRHAPALPSVLVFTPCGTALPPIS